MMTQEISIPVYFAEWSHNLQSILDDVSKSFITDDRAGSAAEGDTGLHLLFQSVSLFKV